MPKTYTFLCGKKRYEEVANAVLTVVSASVIIGVASVFNILREEHFTLWQLKLAPS
jgi:hypothetical protein